MPTALLSVYDKTGIVHFSRGLVGLGWTLYASGGTCGEIKKAKIPVTDTSVITGSGSRFGHRVVTLSAQIANALLAPDTPQGRAELEAAGVPHIDMVVVDPYPTHACVAARETTHAVDENTDVGGPTMLAEGLKGKRLIVCDPRDYMDVLYWLGQRQRIDREDLRIRLA